MEAQSDARREVTRLGRREIWARVHTWQTFVIVHLRADGSGSVRIARNGATLDEISIKSEVVKEQ
jgi:hypothetical protein